MSLAVHAEHLRRYRDIAWLLWKHGGRAYVSASGLDKKISGDFKEDGEPESLAADLESLGPTFIKLGQILASRADLLPPAYLDALSKLQDDVAPVPFEEIEQVLVDELDARPSRIFSEIDPTPLAAASLAQVHMATLRDGRDVVLKVQRPGIQEEIDTDFKAFSAVAQLGAHTDWGRKHHVEDLVAEFKATIRNELDYRLEAENLLTIRANLAEFKRLCVPEPHLDFSSRRVLTLERVSGISIKHISPVVFTEVSGMELAEEFFAAYLKQILVDGFFHADPHPGNVLLTHDHRLGLIDLGQVGRLDEEMRQNLLHFLIAVSEGRGREAGDVAVRIGRTERNFDRITFFERVSDLVSRSENRSVGQIEAGRVVLEIQQIASDAGMRLPRVTTLIGKTLLNLDSIGRILAPDFDPNASIRKHTVELVRRRMWQRLSPGNLLQSTLEATDVAAQLPRRLNELLTRMGQSGFRFEVDAFDEKTFIDGFQKVANRITSGLILAALIIGAALLMRVETEFTLWGYPGLAILLFLGAAFGGVWLLLKILTGDRGSRKR
ncbi:MAG: AarF/ABC1/UbiB kinase family protein [Phycisphaerales bacterium]|nr:AarF/ABC1/UbiB kinase family protein [Phycisphaerales bacterium]